MQASFPMEHRSIRKHGGLYMYTNATEINLGQSGMLGDFQKALIDYSIYYTQWATRCSPHQDCTLWPAGPGSGAMQFMRYRRTLAMDNGFQVYSWRSKNRNHIRIHNNRCPGGGGGCHLTNAANPDPSQSSSLFNSNYICLRVFFLSLEKPFVIIKALDIKSTGILARSFMQLLATTFRTNGKPWFMQHDFC